ncbi:MAG: hypothetical protein QOJ23_3720, partial [Actinomycetota bacterium]|nr:hypothetical protein [Actinomycetota bacterium]
ALRARDETMVRVSDLEAALETARSERDAAVAAQAEVVAGREDAVDTLAARAEGAVVVLPSVALPDAPRGPIAPAKRVSWRPTWSEWAGHRSDDADVVAAGTELGGDDGEEISLDAPPRMEDVGVRRYLNVAATIGQLLPEDLGPLLLSGATVVRREGRLFATVAITADPWAAPGSDGSEQAQRLADAGFRVEWTSVAPLAC